MKEFTFKSGDLEFPVWEFGERSELAVILIHGFPQSRESFREVAEELSARGHWVFVPELRGYAPNARPRAPWKYRLRLAAEDIQELSRTIKAPKIHLVGHDFGGMVIWKQLGHGECARLSGATVLSTPHPKGFIAGGLSGTQLLKSWYMSLVLVPGISRILLARDAWGLRRILQGLGLSESWIHTYVTGFKGDPRRFSGALSWYRGALLSPSYWKLADVSIPVDLIAGGSDPVASVESVLRSELFLRESGGGCEVWGPEGHWLPELAGIQVAHAIDAQLRRER